MGTSSEGVYEMNASCEFPANVIARTSGAPPVPELDERMPSLTEGRCVAVPAAPAVPVRFLSEDAFTQAQQRADWRIEYVPAAGVALLCAAIYLALKISPNSNAWWAALGYLSAVGVSAIIGVGSLYVVAVLFSTALGTFGTVLVRCIAIKTMIDVASLGIQVCFGDVAAGVASILAAAVLLKWMFGLDRLQLALVLLINIFARLCLIGLIIGSAMNARF